MSTMRLLVLCLSLLALCVSPVWGAVAQESVYSDSSCGKLTKQVTRAVNQCGKLADESYYWMTCDSNAYSLRRYQDARCTRPLAQPIQSGLINRCVKSSNGSFARFTCNPAGSAPKAVPTTPTKSAPKGVLAPLAATIQRATATAKAAIKKGSATVKSAVKKGTAIVQSAAKKGTATVKAAIKKVAQGATAFHYETRSARNGPSPTLAAVLAPGSGWTELPQSMSVFHDNGVGKPERKFVHTDGREAVFDGDTNKPVMDPRLMPTYNYVTPMSTKDVKDVRSAAEFAVKGVGHTVTDVVPYLVGGNVRGKDEDVAVKQGFPATPPKKK